MENSLTRLGFNPEGCTTAMGILPHMDPQQALDLAFTLDVPFWPQLPNLSFSEDTYVQTVKGFPGIVVDYENQKLIFDEELFLERVSGYLEALEDSTILSIGEETSVTIAGFKEMARERRDSLRSIRGQFMGPISLCLKVIDNQKKPIIYRDDLRELVIRHVSAKVNRHLQDLRALHPHAFVWVDEPGLELLFTGITGYSAERARGDLDLFVSLLEGPKGIHLCGNPDWDFLLSARIDLLSFNAYSTAEVLEGYAQGFSGMLVRDGVISWGMVPTNFADYERENAESLLEKLMTLWDRLGHKGLDRMKLFTNGMIAPATCCLVNPDLTRTVEESFATVRKLSWMLRDEFLNLPAKASP